MWGVGVYVGLWPGMRQGRGGDLVAPRSAAYPEVDAPWVEGVEYPELLGYLQSRIVGQHHAAAADSDCGSPGRDLSDEQLRARSGPRRRVVVLGNPVSSVAGRLGGLGQLHRLAECVRGGASFSQGRLVDDPECQRSGQLLSPNLLRIRNTVRDSPRRFKRRPQRPLLANSKVYPSETDPADSRRTRPIAALYRHTFLDPLGITGIILPEEGIPWHPDIFSDQGDQLTVPSIAMPYGDLSSWSSGFGNIVQAAPFEFGYYIVGQGRIRWACCGIVSTPENMARWAYELYSPNGSAISESAQVHLLNSFSNKRVPDWGDKDIYGYFVAKRTFQLPSSRVVTAYGHPGGGGGYSSFMRYSPELDLSISILANSELKFRGACRGEKPFDCIASAIFAAYSNILQPTAQ